MLYAVLHYRVVPDFPFLPHYNQHIYFYKDFLFHIFLVFLCRRLAAFMFHPHMRLLADIGRAVKKFVCSSVDMKRIQRFIHVADHRFRRQFQLVSHNKRNDRSPENSLSNRLFIGLRESSAKTVLANRLQSALKPVIWIILIEVNMLWSVFSLLARKRFLGLTL